MDTELLQILGAAGAAPLAQRIVSWAKRAYSLDSMKMIATLAIAVGLAVQALLMVIAGTDWTPRNIAIAILLGGLAGMGATAWNEYTEARKGGM